MVQVSSCRRSGGRSAASRQTGWLLAPVAFSIRGAPRFCQATPATAASAIPIITYIIQWRSVAGAPPGGAVGSKPRSFSPSQRKNRSTARPIARTTPPPADAMRSVRRTIHDVPEAAGGGSRQSYSGACTASSMDARNACGETSALRGAGSAASSARAAAASAGARKRRRPVRRS